MCRLTCPVCNPVTRRRRRKFVEEVDGHAHVEFYRSMAVRWREERK